MAGIESELMCLAIARNQTCSYALRCCYGLKMLVSSLVKELLN